MGDIGVKNLYPTTLNIFYNYYTTKWVKKSNKHPILLIFLFLPVFILFK